MDKIENIKISIQLIKYFQTFNDFQFNCIYSIIENIKKIYNTTSLGVITQILYAHKVNLN